MKHKLFGVLSMLATTMLLAVPSLQAQTLLAADVPFAFSAGNTMMPSGSYRISAVSEQVDLVRNSDSGKAVFLEKAIHIQAVKEPRANLVFDKYGNDYFLREIWDGRSNVGIQLPESKREKELSLAANHLHDGPEIVVVAMNRN